MNAAITAVAQFSERNDAYAQLGWKEEPMEVGAIDVSTAAPPTMKTGNATTRSTRGQSETEVNATSIIQPSPTTTWPGQSFQRPGLEQ